MRWTAAAAVILCSVAVSAQQPDARERLDEVQRLSSQRNYTAAIAMFEAVKAQQPDAIGSLDGLKMVTVYAETGNLAKFQELTRWMVQRWPTPKLSTEAERQVKGYIVHKSAKDPQLVARSVDMTRFASEQAVASGEGQYQGFFDTSRGIALYRAGRYADAAMWLPKTLTHESVYVRSLAQPFYAMTLRAQGDTARASEMMAQARRTAATLPAAGSLDYSVEWTDILISRMVLQEAEEMFATAR
jgi:tetratricopeptide (TPR) repeat protein